MITTGIIREIGISKGNFIGNAYKVELNVFQIPGDNNKNNYTYIANCSTIPCLYDSYAIGDVVYIGFLNNNNSLPIILGKIYQGLDNNSRGKISLSGLEVTGEAKLSKNTVLGGISFEEIFSTVQQNKMLEKKVDSLENSINKTVTLRKDTDNLYICLHNFTSVDIGSKIFLYRTTRRSRSKKGYYHPSDPENLNRSVAAFGYGYIANKPQGPSKEINPSVPSWMGNSGLIKTEWTITQDHLDAGYIKINYRVDWLPLISYDWDTGHFTSFYGSGSRYSGRDNTGALRIKFGLVKGDALLYLSVDTLYLGYKKNAQALYASDPENKPYTVHDGKYKLNLSWFYTLIS